MPFSNDVTGGQGALLRPAIKSPNYVPGSLGWSINRDGSAEFNNITARGTLLVLDATTGTFVRIRNNSGLSIIELNPPNQVGHTFNPGFIVATEFAGPNFGPLTEITSPQIDGLPISQIALVGENGGGPATIDLRSSGSGGRVQILDAMELLGGLPFGFVNSTVTLTSGTTTFQDVAGMSCPVQPDAFYMLEHSTIYLSSAAGQYKFQWTGPAGIAFPNHTFLGRNAAGTLSYGPTGANGSVQGLQGTGAFLCTTTWGLVTTFGAAAGTLQYQAAQTVADAGATQVGAGSYFRLHRIF